MKESAGRSLFGFDGVRTCALLRCCTVRRMCAGHGKDVRFTRGVILHVGSFLAGKETSCGSSPAQAAPVTAEAFAHSHEQRAKPSPSVFTADITKRGEADFSPFPFARKRYFVFSIRASCTTMTYAQPRFKHIRGITQSALHADSARAARYRAFAYALISL